ncbi:flavoprotein [Bacillus thermotolerans]|nr:flavoprotein [Bacillus thermotolerans]
MSGEEMIEAIVNEVIKRLQERMQKATVFFTGGAYGFQESMQQIKQLKEEGWELNVLLSNSAAYVLTPQLIKEELGISEVHVEREVKGLKPYYDGISALIFPTLTLNTAVKVSLGIADNLATNLASHVIMKGIPIIAARDGCDLRSPIREEFGLHKAPQAYVNQVDQYLHQLESFGVKLVKAKELSDVVRASALPCFHKEAQAGSSARVKDVQKRVLTRSDVIEAKQKFFALRVSSATIISPLALDTAKELGVELIRHK